MKSAKGILMLLEAGADFNAAHKGKDGNTALYLLVDHRRLPVLRELAAAGWLAVADFELPGHIDDDQPDETVFDLIKRKWHVEDEEKDETFWKAPLNADAQEMLSLLTGYQELWNQQTRKVIVARLEVQLIPELAELVVSFIDGGKDKLKLSAVSRTRIQHATRRGIKRAPHTYCTAAAAAAAAVDSGSSAAV